MQDRQAMFDPVVQSTSFLGEFKALAFSEPRPLHAVASVCQFDLLSLQHPSIEAGANLLGNSAGLLHFADAGLRC